MKNISISSHACNCSIVPVRMVLYLTLPPHKSRLGLKCGLCTYYTLWVNWN